MAPRFNITGSFGASWAARSPIGVEIDGRSIRCAQVAPGGAGLRLAAAACVERADPGAPLSRDEARGLAGALRRQGFAGRRVVVCVREPVAFTAVVDVPPRSSGAPVEQIARMEIARAHRLEPGGFELACWDLPAPARGGQGSQLMAAVAPHAAAEALLAQFDGSGLEVVALEVRCVALARACGALSAPGALTGIVSVDWDHAQVVVVLGGGVVYERPLEGLGVSRLYEDLRQKEGLDAEAAGAILGAPAGVEDGALSDVLGAVRARVTEWAGEVGAEAQRSLSYSAGRRGGPEMTVLASGRGAAIPGVVEALERSAGIPVRAVRAGDVLEVPPAMMSWATDPALLGAAGAAARPRRAGRRRAA